MNFMAPSLSLNSPTNFRVFTTAANLPRRVLLGLKFQFYRSIRAGRALVHEAGEPHVVIPVVLALGHRMSGDA